MGSERREIHLRPARIEDAPDIASIWFQGWRDGHLGHVSDELAAARTEASFADRAVGRIDDTSVAVVGDSIAGFVMVVADEVEQVYLHADHRGGGTADVLLDEAERLVRQAGHAAAWLAVVGGNTRARRFYERRGWSDHGLFDYLAAGPDGPIAAPSHRYIKTL